MTTISQLSTVTSVAADDAIPLASKSMGVDAKATMSQVLTYIESNFADPNYTVTISTPISGFNQSIAAATTNVWLILTPAGTLATGTVTLPVAADCFDGQTIIVTSTQIISALTVTAGAGTTVGGAPSALAATGFFMLRYNTLLLKWFCVGLGNASSSSFVNVTITDAILDSAGLDFLRFARFDAAVNNLLAYNSATSMGIGVEGAAANIDLEIVAKGTGDILLGDSAGAGSTAKVYNTVSLAYTDVVGLTSTQNLTNKTLTTASILNGTADALKTSPTTVALLAAVYPAASNKSARGFVTDATQAMTAGIGAIVAGGGANNVPVYSDGTDYRIG